MKKDSAEIEGRLGILASSATDKIRMGAQEAERVLTFSTTAALDRIKAESGEVETRLVTLATSTTEKIRAGAQDAPQALTASSGEIESRLGTLATSTAEKIRAGAQDAEHPLTGMSTGVLTHTVSFHEPFDATGWLLLDQEAPYSGRGRFYGRGDVFTANGALVASFAQDGLIRALGGGGGGGTSL